MDIPFLGANCAARHLHDPPKWRCTRIRHQHDPWQISDGEMHGVCDVWVRARGLRVPETHIVPSWLQASKSCPGGCKETLCHSQSPDSELYLLQSHGSGSRRLQLLSVGMHHLGPYPQRQLRWEGSSRTGPWTVTQCYEISSVKISRTV